MGMFWSLGTVMAAWDFGYGILVMRMDDTLRFSYFFCTNDRKVVRYDNDQEQECRVSKYDIFTF
jgi:hypothetical protein